MRKGAIILCGGKSSRMGRDKATLPFGGELMLERVARLVGEIVPLDNVVVVAAPNQMVPEFAQPMRVARDKHEFLGPLAGLIVGLRALEERVDAAYATACDVPLLVPAFIDRMFGLLDDFDVAVPRDGEHHHPLAAVYRPTVLPAAEQLLAAGRLRPRFLFDEVPTREVPVAELRDADPQLYTLRNLNNRQEYHAALEIAGFAAPVETTC